MNNDEKSMLLKAFEKLIDVAVGDIKQNGNGLPVMKSLEPEQRIETSVVYIPNTLDAHDEWMSKSTVANLRDELYKGFIEDETLFLNLWHDTSLLLPKDECEVLDVSLTKSDMYVDDKYIPEGTCVMTIKYHNERLWEMRKEDVIGGFSIHGRRDPFPGENE